MNGGSSGPATTPPKSGTTPHNPAQRVKRMTWATWNEVVLARPKAVTSSTLADLVPLDVHLRRTMGFREAAKAGDRRPVLVYFHWAHKDAVHGKLTTSICKHALDDEATARWTKLFRCVRVDMEKSELKLAKRMGLEDGPSFAVLDGNGKVLARVPGIKSSGKLRKALEAAHRKIPAARKQLASDLKHQSALLDGAKRLEKQKRYAQALELVAQIRDGDVRVGPHYDEAVSLAKRLDARVKKPK